MTTVGLNDTDIQLDANGQPVAGKTGDFATVTGDECWQQDLALEAATDEGELFYETSDGDEAYGFGLTDFAQAEDDELTRAELTQRVRGKIAKRTYLDLGKTTQELSYEDGVYTDRITVAKNDSSDPYNMELTTDDVEVEVESS
jgi:hypothetical protein